MTFGLQKGATGVFKSVLDTDRADGKRREEIFVDVIEKMMCVFSSSGFMQTGQIDGAIQVCPSLVLRSLTSLLGQKLLARKPLRQNQTE